MSHKHHKSDIELSWLYSILLHSARPLNQYSNRTSAGSVKVFRARELSVAGKKLVETEGFFPIPTEYEESNAKVGL